MKVNFQKKRVVFRFTVFLPFRSCNKKRELKIKKIGLVSRFILLPILLFAFLSACSGANKFLIPGGAPTDGNVGQSNPQGGIPSQSSDPLKSPNNALPQNEENTDDSTGRKFDALPQASIPAPTLKKGLIIAYAPDSQATEVVIGQSGAVDISSVGVQLNALDKWRIAISTQPLPESVPSITTVDQNSICTQPNITCCPINPDGSLECAIQLRDSSVIELHMAIVDTETNAIGTYIKERIQERIPFFNDTSMALASSSGMLYSLNGNHISILQADRNTFKLLGNYNQNYRDYDATGAKGISYDTTNNVLSLNKTTRIDLLSLSLTNPGIPQVIDTESIVPNNGEEVTHVKFTEGLLSFETKRVVPRNQAYVYRVRTGFPTDSIQFFWKDISFVNWNHLETVVFDIDRHEYVLAVYKNDLDQIRLRVGNYHISVRYGDSILNGVDTSSLRDLQIYRENSYNRETRELKNGYAILFDSLNNRIGVISYNHIGRNFSVNLDQWIDLGANKNPQAFVLNPNKTRAYVVNKGDGSITVLKLDTANGYPEIAGSIDLKQTYLPNKDFAIVPTNIVYQPSNIAMVPNHLIVSVENLKGALVADVPNL